MSGHLPVGVHHDVPEHIYHGDPAPAPSLSHGIAKLMLYKSPRHAWHAHPRLNTMQEEDADATTAKEEGSALHRLLLGTGHEIVEVEADNWRGKNGDVRREARSRGAIPMLAWRLAELERCAEAARDQLASHHDARNALTAGRPEATVLWHERDVWCRARPDWLPDDAKAVVWDLKTTGKSAAPDEWERTLERDYATQAAFYVRGLTRVRRVRPGGFGFIVVETAPPYALCVYEAGPSLLHAAEQDVEEAIARWRECITSGIWPGYPSRTLHVEASTWRTHRSEDRRLTSQALRAAEGEAA